MGYKCLTCEDEFAMKPNAQKHAEKTGHINMKKIDDENWNKYGPLCMPRVRVS